MLLESALSDRRPRSMRGAAIESLANLTTLEADAALARLAGELGQWEGQARGRYKPDLHADVIRAISLRAAAANRAGNRKSARQSGGRSSVRNGMRLRAAGRSG